MLLFFVKVLLIDKTSRGIFLKLWGCVPMASLSLHSKILTFTK